jgi:hypothetical protein
MQLKFNDVPPSLVAACPSPVPSAAVPYHEPNEGSHKPKDNPPSLMFFSTSTRDSFKLPYPIGCPVCYNIDKEEFDQGKVVSKPRTRYRLYLRQQWPKKYYGKPIRRTHLCFESIIATWT